MSEPKPVAWMVEWPGLSVAFHVELPVPPDDIRAHGATVTPLYPDPGPMTEEWGFRYTDPKDSRYGNVYAQSPRREWPESVVKVALGMEIPRPAELVRRRVSEWEPDRG